MKLFIKISSTLLLIIVLILITTQFLPKEKTTVNQITINKPFFFVWAAVTNQFEEPSWRRYIDTVIQLKNRERDPVWREYHINGDSLTYRITTEVSNKLQVRQIVDDPSNEGSLWAINIMNSEQGAKIRIVEEQVMNNPISKIKFLFNKTDIDVKIYLTDLINKFNKEEEEDNSYGW